MQPVANSELFITVGLYGGLKISCCLEWFKSFVNQTQLKTIPVSLR